MSAFDSLHDFQDQICYVQCGFCTTILLVSVPRSSLSMVVTVKCGHCNSILSVNMMKACFLPLHLLSSLNQQEEKVQPKCEVCSEADKKPCSSSICFSSDDEDSIHVDQVIHKPPEKKQRAPSAYNYFIKEEIKRLKIEHPNMTHKQAFSAAAKNWAHCPQSQYRGGEVHGYVEADNEGVRRVAKVPMIPEKYMNVNCFGNGFHETKALRQSICSKTALY